MTLPSASDLWNAVDLSAIAQIAILYTVIYGILKRVKGSRVGQVLLGVGILAALLGAFTFLFHFDVLSRIVQFLLIYFAISTVVIFQPEIRRVLSTMGAFGFFEKPKHTADGGVTPELLTDSVMALASRKMGALIAIERGISLRGYELTGVALDAVFSNELMLSVFTPPMPLHDGGVTVRHGRVAAAHCIFPVSNNAELISSGMRHRAAVGLSEETDALVIVVSEESGDVSVAHNGRLYRYSGEQAAAQVGRWVAKSLKAGSNGNRLVQRTLAFLQARLPRPKAKEVGK